MSSSHTYKRKAQALAFAHCAQDQAEVCDGVDVVFHGIKRCICIYFYHVWLCMAINRCFCIFFIFTPVQKNKRVALAWYGDDDCRWSASRA